MRKTLKFKVFFFAAITAGFLALASYATGEMPAVRSLKMEQQDGIARYIISKVGAIDCQDFLLKNPSRLVVDFIGARHKLDSNLFDGDGTYVEKVRTSQFMNAPEEITRVVFDLRKTGAHKIKKGADEVVVEFYPEKSSTPKVMTGTTMSPIASINTSWDIKETKDMTKEVASGAGESIDTAKEKPVLSEKPLQTITPQTTPLEDTRVQSSKSPKWQPPTTPVNVSMNSSWAKDRLRSLAPSVYSDADAFASAGSAARNKKVTIDVQNADIKTVLESISEFSGINIVAGPEVTGGVTLHLKKLPWRQALEIILKTHGFGYEEQYGVIRVSTIEKLTKEELDREAAERKKDELKPIITKIIPLSYANAEEMQKALDKIVSKRGNIEVEKGSNALIVSGIQDNVDKVEALAKNLDVKVKQVEIVAKLVDVDVNATRDLGIRWDFLNLAPANVSFVGDAIMDASSPAAVGVFRIGTVRSWGELRAVIDMLEQTNKANIISNPRIVTTDNRMASILVGKEIPLIVADEAGNPITELTKVGIGLEVTPHVNSDNTITLDIHPEVSELSSQATVQGGVIISMSEADTRVIVDNNETAVIGGLISQVESSLERGLPVLKDVPIFGNLFKYKNKTKKKRELIIFITPRVLENISSGSS